MKTKVRLFINDQELEFTGKPSVLYNFNLDNITNPTALKNQYTKTIQVDGTPRNNKIFGHIWDLTRTQSNDFNPSKRTPFELYIDGDLYETGYVKLNNISNTHNKIVYNITLYGGIGDFLYGLSFREDGEQMRLSDLAYIVTGGTSGNPVTELDFRINKDTVAEAWNHLYDPSAYYDPRWDVINFMPAYNGYPNDFDSNKVLINTTGFTGETRVHSGNTVVTNTGFPTSITVDGTTYGTIDGYGYGEINGNMTEWEMRDLRSYMQRPVLRFKHFLGACCDPTQNGGYEVELDQDFFNDSNKWYEDAWITLPMLNDLKYDDEVVDPWSGHCSNITTVNNWYKIFKLVNDTTVGSKPTAMEVTFTPKIYISGSGAQPNPLYCASIINDSDPQWNANAFVYQLVGRDYNDNIVAGSDIFSLTSDVDGRYLDITRETYYIAPFVGGSIYNRFGQWNYAGQGTDPTWGGQTFVYEWSEPITLKVPLNGTRINRLEVHLSVVANLTYTGSTASYGHRRGRMYTSKNIASTSSTNTFASGVENLRTGYTGNVYYSSGAEVNSNAPITKQTLLSVDGSPCQYLTGYLKTFGLYLRKDPLRKKIQILTRKNYYNDEVENWEERIDRTKQMQITPITFNRKWYSFNFTQGDKSATEEKYYEKYGTNYGTEKVNTGYNFDSETNDLLRGIIYKNAADCLEKSPYFVDRYYNGQNNYPPFLTSWVGYTLMKANSDEKTTVDIGSSFNTTDVDYSQYGSLYDQFPKVQFRDKKNSPIDGSCVLVMYNGTKPCLDANGEYVHFKMTDDINQMFEFGDNPCWLYTQGTTNRAGQTIAIDYTDLPQFARCAYSDDRITNTWDFGKTKELYVPGAYFDDTANIYDKWWMGYINDLYDVNTKICEAYVKLPKTQGDTLLRKFYWFDNSLWRINKISDWNVADEDTTKVEFIKVQDKSNYLEA